MARAVEARVREKMGNRAAGERDVLRNEIIAMDRLLSAGDCTAALERIRTACVLLGVERFVAPASAQLDERECEICDGRGTIDERRCGYGFSNPAAKCPDCDGAGWWRPSAPAQPAAMLSWGGFNVSGDPASIAEVKRLMHEAGTVPELRARIAQPAGAEIPNDARGLTACVTCGQPVGAEQQPVAWFSPEQKRAMAIVQAAAKALEEGTFTTPPAQPAPCPHIRSSGTGDHATNWCALAEQPALHEAANRVAMVLERATGKDAADDFVMMGPMLLMRTMRDAAAALRAALDAARRDGGER